MKLSLVVAQGVHSGKVIPVTSTDFIIGRDPLCQLRPASPAVSKQHCGLSIRDGKVYVRDCGSTNGTFVNGEQVAAERTVESGDRLRVGPLEFDLKIELSVPITKSSTTLARSTAAKAPASKAVATDTAPAGGTVVMEPTALADDRDRSSNTTIVDAPGSGLEDDPDHAAALLLGLDDGIASTTPTVEGFSGDPTTVMEMPALAGQQQKKEEPKKNTEDSSSAAAELLSKYMRRPRT